MVQMCSRVLFHVFCSSRVETTKSKGHLTMVVKNFLYTGVCPIQGEAQILVHSHLKLVSWLLGLEATEPVSEPATQMVVELMNIHLISVQQKR